MSPAARVTARGVVWARGFGVSLVRADAATVLADPGLARALADGIEHGYDGPLPAYPDDAAWYLVREAREVREVREAGAGSEVHAGGDVGGDARGDVGVAIVRMGYPRADEAALVAVAIAPEQRGRALASKALLAIERRLTRAGSAGSGGGGGGGGERVTRMLARVPRTNGRGLYFMLRVGYTPVPLVEVPDDERDDVTWFARGGRN